MKPKYIEIVSTYAKDSLGYMYFKEGNEWLIHDCKSILYVVKCEKLIEELEKNQYQVKKKILS